MLPYFKKATEKIEEFIHERINKVIESQIQPFSGAAVSLRFEGDDNKNDSIIRHTGEIDKVDFTKAGSTISYTYEEIENLNINDVILKVDNAAFEMAKQKFNFFVGIIEETTKKTGNVVYSQQKGKFSAEEFFELISKMWIDFDESEKPIFPTMLVGSKEQMESYDEMFKTIDANPNLKTKFDNLIEKKRNEFNARENSRKLVG